MTQQDREEDYLIEQYNRGEITLKEYNFEMREMQRSYQQYAEDCAQDAYDDVMFGKGYY